MAEMKPGKDILAFRRLVESELKKLGVDTQEIQAIDAVSHIARAAIHYAGYFHDSVMGQDH
jgi:hypothetical protein